MSRKEPFLLNGLRTDLSGPKAPISKNGFHLHFTLLKLADAKTGELRYPNGDWIKPERFDREGQMCKRTRMKAMRELVDVGLVRWEWIMKVKPVPNRFTGHVRRRSVRDGIRYWVSRIPRQDWVSSRVQSKNPHKHKGSSRVRSSKSSSRVQSLQPARNAPPSTFSNPPGEGRPCVSGVGSSVENVGSVRSKSSSWSTCGKSDDDRASDAPDRIDQLLAEARTILMSRGHDRDYVDAALDDIDQLAFEKGRGPVSVAYFLRSFENLQHESARNQSVWDSVRRSRELRAMFGFPDDLSTMRLTPEQEEARRQFNAKVENELAGSAKAGG